ncbi:MAG TPA: hypothetical protein VMY42_19325 [Thermoguttaceae bacterium]|nr:hypothetical protein [Thermoguttaceae bacterium]
MIDKQLLEILVCPENRTSLSLAEDELLARLNRAIAAGKIKNRGGQPLQQQLGGGLVREDGTLLYPIVDNIPVLLIDEAVPLDQIGDP